MTRSSLKATPRVAFFDSGIGGVPYLQAYRGAVPHADVTYLADTAFFPYGERSLRTIRDRTEALVRFLIECHDPDLVVVACNTASVVSLAHLREHFPIPFVGVVPAVKPAGTAAEGGAITVLATRNTARDPYTDDLISQFAASARVERVGLPGLVDLVERRRCDVNWSVRSRTYLAQEVVPRIGGDTDAVVLACTHFLHVYEALREMLPAEVLIVDSLQGVLRRIVDLTGAGRAADRPPPHRDAPVRDTNSPWDLWTTSDTGKRYHCIDPLARLKTVTL